MGGWEKMGVCGEERESKVERNGRNWGGKEWLHPESVFFRV